MPSAFTRIAPLAALAASATAGTVALPVTDWLDLQTGAPDTLRNDALAAAATLGITTTQGSPSFTTPAAQTLAAPFWLSDHGFTDSLTTDLTVLSTTIHVLPDAPGGAVDYSIEITGSLRGAVLAIGQVSNVGNAEITLLAADSGGAPLTGLTLLGQHGYDNGLQRFDGLLQWDGMSGVLTPDAANSNESGYAFFALPDAAVASLTIRVRDTAGVPVGDVLSIAVAVPEPGSATLFLSAILPLLFRRRRAAPHSA